MSLKISELTETTSATTTDVLPVVNGGATKKITVENLRAALGVPREYIARLTQSGTSAPLVVSTLANTTGATASYARSAKGTYTLTFSSAVLADTNKCVVHVGSNDELFSIALINSQISDGQTVNFTTIDLSTLSPADDLLNAVLSVKIY